jgi:hypothetical protein
MADRNFPSSSDLGAYADFVDKVAEAFGLTIPASVLPLTNVAGTANNVTADVNPVLPDSGLAAGMVFSITWAATNTEQSVTLAIGDESAVDVIDADGTTLEIGQIEDGRTDILGCDGTALRLLSGGAEIDMGSASVVEYTSSTTWVNNVAPNRMILVELVGGGDDGTTTSGGDGGEYVAGFFKAGDLTSTVALGVGAGGGNDTTFGSYLTARGGYGQSPAEMAGGAGGANGESGTRSTWGGGGGAGSGGATGGPSQYGGDGGSPGNDGAEPGGGGGANGSGAGGMARISVF